MKQKKEKKKTKIKKINNYELKNPLLVNYHTIKDFYFIFYSVAGEEEYTSSSYILNPHWVDPVFNSNLIYLPSTELNLNSSVLFPDTPLTNW